MCPWSSEKVLGQKLGFMNHPYIGGNINYSYREFPRKILKSEKRVQDWAMILNGQKEEDEQRKKQSA